MHDDPDRATLDASVFQREDAELNFRDALARQRRRRHNAAQVIGLTTTVALFYLSGGFQMLEPSSGLSAVQVLTSLPALVCGGIGALVGCVYLAVVAERDGDRAPGA